MKYLFFTLLFTICFCQYTYARDLNMEEKRKASEQTINITIKDVYELEKTKATNMKNFFQYMNEIYLNEIKNNFVKDREYPTDIRYCFYSIKPKEIYYKLLEEYKKGYWSYNARFLTAETVLVWEKCMPEGLATRQQIYDKLTEYTRQYLMDISTPILQTRSSASTNYYMY